MRRLRRSGCLERARGVSAVRLPLWGIRRPALLTCGRADSHWLGESSSTRFILPNMKLILPSAAAVLAAAIGCYAAAIQFACVAQGCSRSRVELIFLACVAAATIAAAFSAVVWHRFTPAILATIIPCLAAIYLFELVARTPHDRHTTQILTEVGSQRSRGIQAVPPYGFAAGRGVTLQDGSAVYPLTGPS